MSAYFGKETSKLGFGLMRLLKKALVDRYPWDSYTLATKFNAFLMCHDEKSDKAPGGGFRPASDQLRRLEQSGYPVFYKKYSDF